MRIPGGFRGRSSAGLVVLAALSCAGCAGDYQQAVKAFAEATTASKAALAESRQTLSDDLNARRVESAVKNPDDVIPAAGECRSAQVAPCHLVLREGEKSLRQSDYFATVSELAELLDSYAQGLRAITDADTAAKVQTSIDKVNGSLGNIANVVGSKTNAESFAEFSKPVSALVSWGFGEYIAIVKEHAVRDAATKADPLVQKAALVFGNFTQDAADLARNKEFIAFDDAETAFRKSPGDSALRTWIQAAAALERVSMARDNQVMKELAAAHQALVKSFDDPDSLRDAFARFEKARDDANALADILKSLRDAAQKQKG